LKGVTYAIPFLKNAKLGNREKLDGRVAVIGGGNGAIDAARTALRLGAGEVHLISTRPRESMPAFDWMIEMAEEEGVLFHHSLIPEGIFSKNGKMVNEINLRRVLFSERYSRRKVKRILDESPEAVVRMEVDQIIIAVGQAPDVSWLGGLGIEVDRGGNILVDPITHCTTLEGVFAAGDAIGGGYTVTEAMAAGRNAARGMMAYLDGSALNAVPLQSNEEIYTGIEAVPIGEVISRRVRMPLVSKEERIHNFSEVELGFTEEEAFQEARRCLKCKTCLRCLEETKCTALNIVDNSYKKSPSVDARICGGCGVCAKTCPYQNIYVSEID
jgi:NADPH-dependent glutamate synthase beta subunit-like oxidoreductase